MSRRLRIGALALLLAGCGAAPPPVSPSPPGARARVRTWLAADRDEDGWADDPEAAAPLAELARDPDEPPTLRIRAVVVLGEVYSSRADVRGALRWLACHPDPGAPSVSARAIDALDPAASDALDGVGSGELDAWRATSCVEPAAPTPPEWAPAAGAFALAALGLGVDDSTIGATGTASLGVGLTLHFGVRYGDLSILLAAHGLGHLYLADQTRWYAGAGPLAFVDVALEETLHVALGGGFDYGAAGVRDAEGERSVAGVFPSFQLRMVASEGLFHLGGMVHVVIPPEAPDLFALAIGVLAGFATP